MSRERAQETARLVNAALEAGDFAGLRRLAAVRGLSPSLRPTAWCALLGVDPAVRVEDYAPFASGAHRDSAVVVVDVDRSLFRYAAASPAWPPGRLADRRAALRRVLDAVVNRSRALSSPSSASPAPLHYCQGLHSVAAVILLVAGERLAYGLVDALFRLHLRDATRPTLEPVQQTLALLLPLLSAADPELGLHLTSSGLLPYFGLPWLLTWHAHDAPDLESAARLFDLFLSSTPLMPLYVGAALVVRSRARLLGVARDAAELHAALSALPVVAPPPPPRGGPPGGAGGAADALCAAALALHRRHPPGALQRAAGVRLAQDCAAARWPFPPPPPPPPAAPAAVGLRRQQQQLRQQKQTGGAAVAGGGGRGGGGAAAVGRAARRRLQVAPSPSSRRFALPACVTPLAAALAVAVAAAMAAYVAVARGWWWGAGGGVG